MEPSSVISTDVSALAPSFSRFGGNLIACGHTGARAAAARNTIANLICRAPRFISQYARRGIAEGSFPEESELTLPNHMASPDNCQPGDGYRIAAQHVGGIVDAQVDTR